MKQEIHTSPVAEAFLSGDECPFCYLQRQAEQRAIRYFAGPSASYMEPTVRGITNDTGLCAHHTKALYDYGNPLGSALMLQTHYERLLLELRAQMDQPDAPARKKLFQKKIPTQDMPYYQQLQHQLPRCAICDRVEENMQRQYRVFFSLLAEAEFRQMIEQCNGFCLEHFARLLQEAQQHLPQKHRDWFYPTVYRVMEENLTRVKADLDWLIEKYDYRNSDAPWGNSKDALQRAMQKLSGIYPADAPYRKD